MCVMCVPLYRSLGQSGGDSVGGVTSSEDVRLPIEPFIAALRVHAEAMERNAPVAEAMPAINALRQAASAYVEAVMEVSGWGNVFAGLFDDEEDDDSDVESDAPVTGITVLRRHDYAVVVGRDAGDAGRRCLVRRQQRRQAAPRRPEEAERVRPVRPARQRRRVGHRSA